MLENRVPSGEIGTFPTYSSLVQDEIQGVIIRMVP